MKTLPAPSASALRPVLCAVLLLSPVVDAAAADLVVRVSGLKAPVGQVGCTLFSSERGFPTDGLAAAASQWVAGTDSTATCRFPGLSAGRYAVSVAHDANGNRRIDTNLVGIPKEQWGVSNNVRPTMRAPRFDEAAFTIDATDGEIAIDVRLQK